jgi:hypothetical protein
MIPSPIARAGSVAGQTRPSGSANGELTSAANSRWCKPDLASLWWPERSSWECPLLRRCRHRSGCSRRERLQRAPRKASIRRVGQTCRRKDFPCHSSQAIRSSKPPGSSQLKAFSWLNSPVQNEIGRGGDSVWVEQLYTTPCDVQTQHARFFFATGFFFSTLVGGKGDNFPLYDVL